MPAAPASRPAGAVRRFGRFRLLQLLARSGQTMQWRASDEAGAQLRLAMPRSAAASRDALQRWQAQAQRVAKAVHPALAPVVEIGAVEHWPYVVYACGEASSLAERLGHAALPATEVVPWAIQLLEGLAYAHEAGIAHRDLHPSMVVVDTGGARLMGLGVAHPESDEDDPSADLQLQREAAERDVLSFGLLLHWMLAGAPALDESDLARAIRRMPPSGREIVRLPWQVDYPIAQALRAIVNRSTDREERKRYRNARTLAGALDGWWRTEGEHGSDPLALLFDRLRSVGLLPSCPGGAERAARLALMEREPANELARVALEDVGLTFELLRLVNSARVRGGGDPVLTVRRAIALVGLEGVRGAALALRPWPGALSEGQAAELALLIERSRFAARVAQGLRPAGYDAEVVYLLTLLQNLGRMVIHYHFPDEAQQIRRLMQPAVADQPGAAANPAMTEQGASFAVLGLDIEALGVAIGRHWGLGDSVLSMIRRPALARPPRGGESDTELLRLTAACANEVAEALDHPVPRRGAALQRVLQRYGRALGLKPRDLERAIDEARQLRRDVPAPDAVAA
jgi:HD-like signal output (HDOD) protein